MFDDQKKNKNEVTETSKLLENELITSNNESDQEDSSVEINTETEIQKKETDGVELSESISDSGLEPASLEEESAIQATSQPKEGSPQLRDQLLEQFQRVIEGTPDIGIKLQRTIDFMETSLSQDGTPHFKNFWEARRLAMNLFKEASVNPILRSALWNKQIELSEEARRLKTILDEQSAFAVEQIEMAIKSLEEDLENLDIQVKVASQISLPDSAYTLRDSSYDYHESLKAISILNTFASRTNSLRNELIQTDMRVRTKNNFFQRLSAAGDKIFPKRKLVIREISDAYQEDVEKFVNRCEKKEVISKNLRAFRDEIKGLQSAAKILTLNTRVFGNVRKKLSLCWDTVRELDKERRHERNQQIEEFAEKTSEIQKKIEEIAKEFSEGTITAKIAEEKFSQISDEMRNTHLGRNEITLLKESLQVARKPIHQVLDAERLEKEQKKSKEKEKLAVQKSGIKEKLESLMKEESEPNQLKNALEELTEELTKQKFTPTEEVYFNKKIRDLQEKLAFSEKEQLLAVVEGRKEALKQLLETWNAWRKTVRDELETLRKIQDSSGLDFEKAMLHREAKDGEKKRLQRISKVIQELERELSAT